jgi:hypothetical protein
MHTTDPTVSRGAPAIDRAEIRRFAEIFRVIDPCAMPSGSLARRLHLALAGLGDAAAAASTLEKLADALVPVYGALAAIDEAALDEATPRELMELIVRVDDAKALLEMPDLSAVPAGALAAWFRHLYTGIMRLRIASSRLHRAWMAAGVTR